VTSPHTHMMKCTKVGCADYNKIVPSNHTHTETCNTPGCTMYKQAFRGSHSHTFPAQGVRPPIYIAPAPPPPIWVPPVPKLACKESVCIMYGKAITSDHRHVARCVYIKCPSFGNFAVYPHPHWITCTNVFCSGFNQVLSADHVHNNYYANNRTCVYTGCRYYRQLHTVSCSFVCRNVNCKWFKQYHPDYSIGRCR
jgi:hypothetical protein